MRKGKTWQRYYVKSEVLFVISHSDKTNNSNVSHAQPNNDICLIEITMTCVCVDCRVYLANRFTCWIGKITQETQKTYSRIPWE